MTPVHAVLLTPRSWKWSPSPSPPKPFMHFSPITPTCPVYLILHNCITLITFCEEQTSWSSALRNFHQSPVTSPLLGTNTFLTNYKNNQQDALYRLIYYSRSALHVSGDVFAHNQEHFTVFTVSGSVHPWCCRLVSWMSLNAVSTHPRHQPAATWVDTTRYCKYSLVLLVMGENIARNM